MGDIAFSKVRYLHVERVGSDEIADFLGFRDRAYVFPKMDGTNAVIWRSQDDDSIRCGSRNRELSIESDNAGFCRYAMTSDDMEPLRRFLEDNPGYAVYGEWLCNSGHIKEYVEQRVFYVFDVRRIPDCDDEVSKHIGYLPYDEYSRMLAAYGVGHVLEPLRVFGEDEAIDDSILASLADSNHFNLPPGVVGEGVVIKKYGYKSAYGNYEVAKVVRSEFKELKGKKKMPDTTDVESAIAYDFVSANDVEKTKAKIAVMRGSDFSIYDRTMMAMLMDMVYRDMLEEEIVNISKKYGKSPITFCMLKRRVCERVRSLLGIS